MFNLNREYYRLNWNRQKIIALNECSQDISYIDSELWGQCIRYSKQQVKINISAINDLDSLAPKLLKQIKDLDSFEILQKAFYNYFYPALYALKNSFKSNNQVHELIEEFIKGRELECAILGNADAKASFPGEIVISKNYEFYTYEAKYEDENAVVWAGFTLSFVTPKLVFF